MNPEQALFPDASESVLFAQVLDGDPRMKIDGEGYLRAESWPGGGRSVFLGDVTKAVLRFLGPHDPPQFSSEPGYDEQRWELTSSSGDVSVKITSDSYWGFGLFAKCFYNKIEIRGPVSLRARCIHDVVASLGRNPWEPFWLGKFERVTGVKSEDHHRDWISLVRWASDEMSSQIRDLEERITHLSSKGDQESLSRAKMALEEATGALMDRNAPAVERALGRANTALIEADLSLEDLSSEHASIGLKVHNEGNSMPFFDLSEE
ncbi:MAG: hypothetical protein CMA21_02110 [Euryarchaeota archaeon]|nr:hypothetical protein [Euryarchaeota archaeon]